MVNLTERLFGIMLKPVVVLLLLILHYPDLLGMGIMSGPGLVVTAGANFVQTAVKPLSGWAKHDIRTPIHHQDRADHPDVKVSPSSFQSWPLKSVENTVWDWDCKLLRTTFMHCEYEDQERTDDGYIKNLQTTIPWVKDGFITENWVWNLSTLKLHYATNKLWY